MSVTFNLCRVEIAHLFCYAVTSWKLHDLTEVKALHFSNRSTAEALSQNNEIKIWKIILKRQWIVALLRALANYTSRLSTAMSALKY